MHLDPLEAAHRLAPSLGLNRGETRMLGAIWAAGEEGLPCGTSEDAVAKVNTSRLKAKLRDKLGGEWIGTALGPHPKGPRWVLGRYYLKRRAELELRAKAAPPRAPFAWGLGLHNKWRGRPSGAHGNQETLALALCAAEPGRWVELSAVNALLAASGSKAKARNMGCVIVFDLRGKLAAHGVRIERRPGMAAAWRIHPDDFDRIPLDLRAPGLAR